MTNEETLKEIKKLLKQKESFSWWRVLEAVTSSAMLGVIWVAAYFFSKWLVGGTL